MGSSNLTSHPDQDRLVAYVDGELSLDDREAVQDLIARDAAAAAIVERLMDSRERAAGSFAGLMASNPPPALLDALGSASPSPQQTGWRHVLARWSLSRVWRFAIAPGALAATCLLLAILVVPDSGREEGFSLAAGDGLDIPADIQPALIDMLASGTSERTGSLSASGSWSLTVLPASPAPDTACRLITYALNGEAHSVGLACQVENGWRVTTLVLDP